MKTNFKNIGLAFLATITLFSCSPNEEAIPTTTAPTNVAPISGKSFSADEALQPITFRWTPVVPKPQQAVTYRLKVWQLMQGQNSTEAMRSNPPIVEKEVMNVTEITVSGIYTGPCRPPYLCDFVWTVEVITPNGTPNGETQATSNPSLFSF